MDLFLLQALPRATDHLCREEETGTRRGKEHESKQGKTAVTVREERTRGGHKSVHLACSCK